MKKLFIFLLILVLIPVALLAYLGVVPGLSKFVTKPVDLGVSTEKELVYAFESKHSMKKDGSGKIELVDDLSGQQVTSIFAVWEDRDIYFPLKNVQVRFNSDGTGEASGYLEIATAVSLAKNLGYSDADIQKGKDYIKYVAGDLPFYVKGTGGMTNNVLEVNPTNFQIGKVNVPESITSPLSKVVEDMVYRRLNQIGGANVRDANFKDGKLHLDATVPDSIKY
jgi:hypothetical protein